MKHKVYEFIKQRFFQLIYPSPAFNSLSVLRIKLSIQSRLIANAIKLSTCYVLYVRSKFENANHEAFWQKVILTNAAIHVYCKERYATFFNTCLVMLLNSDVTRAPIFLEITNRMKFSFLEKQSNALH